MKKRLFKCLCAFLSIPLLLTGCWQETPPDTEEMMLLQQEDEPDMIEPKIILPEIFSLPYAPDQSLDPVSCPDGMQQVVSSLLYESLFRLNHELEPEPYLCINYFYDAENYLYTFYLRPGITFSDNTPLTATDVKTVLDRARKSERYGARLSDISSISVSDDNTLQISLRSANTALPALLDIPIVKAGTEQESAPIGTGPYLFSAGETGACLVANQSWWQGSGHPTDRIALVEAADQDTMLYRFTSHDVQLVTADLTGTAPISATGNVAFQDAHTTILQYIGFNVTREPFNNATFRRILGQGINRPYIISAFLSGHGTATQFPISPVTSLYPANLETQFSLDTFSSALAASGYTADEPLSLLVNQENAFKVSVANYLAETYTAAGMPITVHALPWADYLAALSVGEFDLYYGEVKLPADWDLSALLAAGGSLNYGGWADPQTDRLISNLASSDDRAGAAHALCSYLRIQSPILPLCFKSTSVLMQTNVLNGLSPTMAEPFYNLTDCTISLEKS